MPSFNLKSKISLDTTQFSAGLRRVKIASNLAARNISKAFRAVGSSIARVVTRLGKMAAIAGAITFAAAIAGAVKLGTALKGAFDAGGALSDLSARTGIAVKELVILEQAFKDNGVSADKVGTTINKMQKSIVDAGNGLSTQVRAFEKLGFSYDEIKDKSPLQQFEQIQRALVNIENPTTRAAVAMDIFGRSGGELQALFQDGGAISKAAVTIGGQADILDKNAQKFDRISDLLANAGTKLQGFFVGVADVAAPKILEALEKFNTLDFSGIGQRMASSFTDTAKFVQFAFGDAITNAMAAGYALMRGLFWADGLSFIGDAVINVFKSIGQGLADQLLRVFDFVSEQFMSEDEIQGYFAGNKGSSIKETPEEKSAKKTADFINSIKDEFKAANFGFSKQTEDLLKKIMSQPAGSQKSESDIYDAEADAQRKRVAAEMAEAAKQEQQTPKTPATIPFIMPALPGESGTGFKGLDALNKMQDRLASGTGPGQGAIRKQFGKNAGALSRANQDGVGGGLGAVRYVSARDQASQKEANKEAKTQLEALIDQNELLTDQNKLLERGLAV